MTSFGAETKSPPFGQDAVPFPPSFAPGHCPGVLEMLGIPPPQQNKQKINRFQSIYNLLTVLDNHHRTTIQPHLEEIYQMIQLPQIFLQRHFWCKTVDLGDLIFKRLSNVTFHTVTRGDAFNDFYSFILGGNDPIGVKHVTCFNWVGTST